MTSCAWCGGDMPAGIRSDAVCCSKRCRQARHRFAVGVGSARAVAAGHPRRLAYADPPYPGKSAKYYRDHPDYAGEVDHVALVASLSADYDAWALSTSAAALQYVLGLCPPGTRVAAWHRGERDHKDATGPLNAWEPVLYGGNFRRVPRPRDVSAAVERDVSRHAGEARRVAEVLNDASRRAAQTPGGHDASRGSSRRVDSLIYRAGARTTEPGRVTGSKPAAFWGWLFELLGATPADTFVDIFPASGAGARAWSTYIDLSRSTAVQRVASIQAGGMGT